MLSQIIEIAQSHQPDAVVISGDIFHSAQPPAWAQTIFANAMLRLAEACPETAIIATAGNHDSAVRHEIFRTPWQALRVHALGTLHKDTPDDHIIPLPSKGCIVAMPYVGQRNLPEGFCQQLLERAAELTQEGLPIVMMAHTAVGGCDFKGHDNPTEYSVGGIEYMKLEDLGTGYDYLALGHIHRRQTIKGSHGKARYCGTPMPVSFDETYPHSVDIVTLPAAGTKPEIEEVTILTTRPLVNLPAEGFADFDEALRLLAEFPDDNPAYVRLNVEVDNFLPATAQADATRIAESKACRYCGINSRRKERDKEKTHSFSVREFQSAAPIDIALKYANDLGMAFDDEMQNMFEEAVRSLDEDQRNN